MTKLQALQASVEDVLTLLKIVRKYEDVRMNWSEITEEWKILSGTKDLTRFYRAVPTCERLGIITYEKLNYIRLELNGERLLEDKDPTRFFAMLLIRRDKVLEAILRAYDRFNLVRGLDFVDVSQIMESLMELGMSAEFPTLHRNLKMAYQSAQLVEVKQDKIRLNVKRYKELSGRKIGRGKDEITENEFFSALISVYDHLSLKIRTKYVPIPEIRRYVCRKLDADFYEEVFDSRLRKSSVFHFHGKTILLVSPRGPRGEGSIRGHDGRWYHYILVS